MAREPCARASSGRRRSVDVPAFVDELIAPDDARGEGRPAAASWPRPGAAARRSRSIRRAAAPISSSRSRRRGRASLPASSTAMARRMARIMQTAAVERIADEDPADLRRRHHPRPPHDLPGAAGRGRELRARSCTPNRRGRGVRGRRARASTGPSRRWSTSLATSAGGGASKAAAKTCCSGACSQRRGSQGFQGEDLKSNEHLLACIKHFAAYGAAESGLDYNTVDMSEQRLREVYLQPYKAGFDAGALSAMASFNEINGVPSTGNHWLMTDLLRGEWGFQGFVVSDYTGDEEMIAARLCKGWPRCRAARLPRRRRHEHAERPLPPASARSRAKRRGPAGEARRVGSPRADAEGDARPVRRSVPTHRRRSAKRRDRCFPDARTGARGGPQVDRPAEERWRPAAAAPLRQEDRAHRTVCQRASTIWSVPGSSMATMPRRSILRPASARRSPTRVRLIVAQGSGVEEPLAGGIEQAVAAARQADIIVLAIGEGANMSGEAQSRTEIVVPEPQQQLAEAVAAVGKPVVVVLKHGRALALEGAVANARAILATWFLGTETGNAIADVLFGAYGPSGRLPASFPRARARSLIIMRTRAPDGRTRRAICSPTRPISAGSRTARSIPSGTASPTERSNIRRFSQGAPAMADERSDRDRCDDHQPRHARRRGSGSALHARAHGKRHPAGSRAEGLPQDCARARAVGGRALHPALGDLGFYGATIKPTVEPGTFDVWIAPSAES